MEEAGKPSAKARQRRVLSSKMHKLAPTSATGVGGKFATMSNRVVAQGKRCIWAGPGAALKVPRTLSDQFALSHPLPSTEALRAGKIFKLRKQLNSLCRDRPPPALAFERWLFDDLLFWGIQHARLAAERTEPLSLRLDPVLFGSSPNDRALKTLKSDLVRASIPGNDADKIVKAMCKHISLATDEVKRHDSGARQLLGGTSGGQQVVVQRHRHTLDVFLSPGKKGQRRTKKQILKLNHEHYAKLCALWRIHTLKATQADDAKQLLEPNSALEHRFHQDLYSLLARYYALQGHGFQAACPESVFHVLQERLGVQHECFASPLNCYCGSYSSMFPDTDVPFGSRGSFWNLQVPEEGGSFEANPPFVHNVMVAMVDQLDRIFGGDDQRPTAPLSFAIILPAWLEDSSYQRLCAHEFLVKHFVISQRDHGFCDGAQHQRRDRYRASPYDTAFFLLQNAHGQSKWPSGREFERDLRQAFAAGVPTAAMVKRRKKRGRGFADQDGGGGVYKGRKKNKRGLSVNKRKNIEKKRRKQNSLKPSLKKARLDPP